MTAQERLIRQKLTLLISECYSKEGSACKLHVIFRPQVFLNKLFEKYSVTHRLNS